MVCRESKGEKSQRSPHKKIKARSLILESENRKIEKISLIFLFLINPSGNSSISGVLTVGGDISDGSKTIYDSTSGKLDYSVLPYHKGDLASDWASNSDTSGYYDISELSAENVREGVSYGRGSAGSLPPCASGTATTSDISCGKTADIDGDGVVESGTLCPLDYVCDSGSCVFVLTSGYCDTYTGVVTGGADNVFCEGGDMWSTTFASLLSYYDALPGCANLDYAGFTDWSLPSKNQFDDVCGDGPCLLKVGGIIDWARTHPTAPEVIITGLAPHTSAHTSMSIG